MRICYGNKRKRYFVLQSASNQLCNVHDSMKIVTPQNIKSGWVFPVNIKKLRNSILRLHPSRASGNWKLRRNGVVLVTSPRRSFQFPDSLHHARTAHGCSNADDLPPFWCMPHGHGLKTTLCSDVASWCSATCSPFVRQFTFWTVWPGHWDNCRPMGKIPWSIAPADAWYLGFVEGISSWAQLTHHLIFKLGPYRYETLLEFDPSPKSSKSLASHPLVIAELSPHRWTRHSISRFGITSDYLFPSRRKCWNLMIGTGNIASTLRVRSWRRVRRLNVGKRFFGI